MRNIVFDVGGVLVQLRYGPFIEYLAAAGADMRDLRTWAAVVGLEHHESGKLRGERFLERVATSVPRALDRDELGRRWLDMFAPDEQMFALARGLDGRLPRIPAQQRRRPALGASRRELRHCQSRARRLAVLPAGAIKPNAAIYRAAEAEFGLDPAETVFIDDLAAERGGRPQLRLVRDRAPRYRRDACGARRARRARARVCGQRRVTRKLIGEVRMPTAVPVAILLLLASNVFMTFAWYAHLQEHERAARGTSPRSRAGASRCSSTCCRSRPTASATR